MHVLFCRSQVLNNNDLFVKAGDKHFLSAFGTVRWGVAGVGKIADDFCSSLAFLPGAELAAAAAGSSADRAAAFAKRHGFACSYGSYRELADDKEARSGARHALTHEARLIAGAYGAHAQHAAIASHEPPTRL